MLHTEFPSSENIAPLKQKRETVTIRKSSLVILFITSIYTFENATFAEVAIIIGAESRVLVLRDFRTGTELIRQAIYTRR